MKEPALLMANSKLRSVNHNNRTREDELRPPVDKPMKLFSVGSQSPTARLTRITDVNAETTDDE